MQFVLNLVAALLLGGVQGQQCPNDNIVYILSDVLEFADPLISPLCLRCEFNSGSPFPSDIAWSLNGNALTNGSMNGEVLIDPVNQNTLIILNLDNILSVGDNLTCSSVSVSGEHIIMIEEFIFINPTLSPDGGSDMTVDVTEGIDLTLSCEDPGNTGITHYQWFDNNGSSLTAISTNPPLTLSFTKIQRNSSGLYICQSTKDNVPGVIKMSNVTINVQSITSPSPASVTLLKVYTVTKCTTILSSLSSLPLPTAMITICNTSLTTSPPSTGDVNQTLIEIGIPIGLSTFLILFIILILIVVLLFHNYVIQKKYKHKSTIEMEEVCTRSTHSLLSHSSGDNYIHLSQDMALYPSHHDQSSFILSTAPSIPNEIPEINVRAPTPTIENDLISLNRTEPLSLMANTPKPSKLGLSTKEMEEGCSHGVSDHLFLPHHYNSRSESETSLIVDYSIISSGYETSSQPSCCRERTHSILSTQSTLSTRSLSSRSSGDNYIHLSQDIPLYPSHHDQSSFTLPTAPSIPNEIPEINVRPPTPLMENYVISQDRTEPFSLMANTPKPSMLGLSTIKAEEGCSHGVSDHFLLLRSRSTSETSSIGDYSPVSSGYETSSQLSSYHRRPHSILSTQSTISTHSLSSHSSRDNYIHLSQDIPLCPSHHHQSSFTLPIAPSIPNKIPEINIRAPTPTTENDVISQDRTEPFSLMANTPKPSTLGLSSIKAEEGHTHGVNDHLLLSRSRSTSETSSIGDYSPVSSGYETSFQPSSYHGRPHSILSIQSTLSTHSLSSHSSDDTHFILDGNDINLLDALK